MALPVPRSLSPSKVSSFKDCALAFRFSVIDRLPEPPAPHLVKGTLVHRALEGLFWDHPRGARTPAAGQASLQAAWLALQDDPEFVGLGLDDEQRQAFVADAETLVAGYFQLEDPDTIDAVGVELLLEAEVGGLTLRGIIDRLDVTPEGEFIVIDYKTGRVPSEMQEHSRLGGVQFYALLCEQVLGRRPISVRLLYLKEPLVIAADPSEQALRGLRQRTTAVWSAIERACADEDFRPKPSALCTWCSFQAYCPAFGGDPALASALGDAAGLATPVALAPPAALATPAGVASASPPAA
jgi:putative RecB family exonuclease